MRNLSARSTSLHYTSSRAAPCRFKIPRKPFTRVALRSEPRLTLKSAPARIDHNSNAGRSILASAPPISSCRENVYAGRSRWNTPPHRSRSDSTQTRAAGPRIGGQVFAPSKNSASLERHEKINGRRFLFTLQEAFAAAKAAPDHGPCRAGNIVHWPRHARGVLAPRHVRMDDCRSVLLRSLRDLTQPLGHQDTSEAVSSTQKRCHQASPSFSDRRNFTMN